MIIAQLCENITELYTLNGFILWHANYISIKLLQKRREDDDDSSF